MAKFEFDFDKPYDEFSVNGEDYKVYFDDDSLNKYQKQAQSFYKEAAEKEKIDVENLSDEEREKLREEQIEMARNLIEMFFGKGSYDSLYEASGRSLINLLTICDKLLDWLNTKVDLDKDEKKDYYLNNKKKK